MGNPEMSPQPLPTPEVNNSVQSLVVTLEVANWLSNHPEYGSKVQSDVDAQFEGKRVITVDQSLVDFSANTPRLKPTITQEFLSSSQK